MTLKEAIESGLPFRRPSWPVWQTFDDGILKSKSGHNGSREIGIEHAIADDYIVKPEPVVFEFELPLSDRPGPDEWRDWFNANRGRRVRMTCESLP